MTGFARKSNKYDFPSCMTILLLKDYETTEYYLILLNTSVYFNGLLRWVQNNRPMVTILNTELELNITNVTCNWIVRKFNLFNYNMHVTVNKLQENSNIN